MALSGLGLDAPPPTAGGVTSKEAVAPTAGKTPGSLTAVLQVAMPAALATPQLTVRVPRSRPLASATGMVTLTAAPGGRPVRRPTTVKLPVTVSCTQLSETGQGPGRTTFVGVQPPG